MKRALLWRSGFMLPALAACDKDDDDNNSSRQMKGTDSTYLLQANLSNRAGIAAGQLAATKGPMPA